MGAQVSFDDASRPGARATFSATGRYVLRLTADDHVAAPVSDSVVLSVGDALDGGPPADGAAVAPGDDAALAPDGPIADDAATSTSADAGVAGGADATPRRDAVVGDEVPTAVGGGCGCASVSGSDGSLMIMALALALVGVRRASLPRRSSARGGASVGR
jgi:MYXO-CTERM domain-containing protein